MFFRTNDDEHDNIEKAVESLRMGGVVLYQTTSPWQRTLSCDATNEVAVKKIIDLKGGVIQPADSLVIVQDEVMLADFVAPLPYFIRQFLHSQEKSVTVIYPSASDLASSACYKDGSVPVRLVPSIDTPPIQMSRHVLRLLGKPLFATSSTIGESQTVPANFQDIDERMRSGVDHVSPLLFGIDDTSALSTIIKYDNEGHVTIVRK